MGPLLGLLGLAGGALGQDWYFDRETREGGEKIKGLLGRAPDAVPDGGYANPDPGSGLMRDPGNIRNQLEFAAGVLGNLNRRQQSQVMSVLEPMLGRASQADLSREGWNRQAVENALGRNQSQSQFDVTDRRITEQYQGTMQFNREKFGEEVRQFGEREAWDRKKHNDQQALAWASERRQAAASVLERQLKGLQIRNLLDPVQKLPEGYRGVMIPGGPVVPGAMPSGVMGPGAPTDSGRFVAAPMRGTKPWEEAQEKVDVVAQQRQNIAKYVAHLQRYGTEHVGEQSGVQSELYNRVLEGMGVLANVGVLNVGDVPRLQAELPNPTSFMRGMVNTDTLIAQLKSLDRSYVERWQRHANRYAGWGLEFTDPDLSVPGSAKGRDAPPAGSKPVGRP